ncbi:STM3941 family protein [Paenibacillus lactis]|uniref:STM3941 family protein n=1 Tax=Paenibacillus lactis TaxID=228574 RepID=UPI0011AA3D40
MPRQEEIHIKPKVTKLLLGSLIFVALGIFMIYAGAGDRQIVLVIIGFLCTLFFGALLVFFMRKLVQRKPALVINDEGIIDRSSYVSVGAIPWSEIKGMDIYQVMNERFIGIEVHHPEEILARLPGWKQKLMRMNKGMTNATIHLSASGLSCNLNELFLTLYRRWKISKNDDITEMTEVVNNEELQA